MALVVSKSSKSKKFEHKGSTNFKVSEKSKITGKFNGKCHQKLGYKKADCFLLKKTENKLKSKDEEKQGTTFLCNSGEVVQMLL